MLMNYAAFQSEYIHCFRYAKDQLVLILERSTIIAKMGKFGVRKFK